MSDDLPRYWILVEHEPLRASLLEWARWLENADRTVAYTIVSSDVAVSTVFLPLEPIDSRLREMNPPLLFETMIFGGIHDGLRRQYCSWDEALNGHWSTVRLAKDVQEGVKYG